MSCCSDYADIKKKHKVHKKILLIFTNFIAESDKKH